MFGPLWESSDAELLKSCRFCSGLPEADFARAHSLSVLQLRELEVGGNGHFYTELIKARAGMRILAKFGHAKDLPAELVQRQLQTEVSHARYPGAHIAHMRKRNRREMAMLASCAVVVGFLLVLPQLELTSRSKTPSRISEQAHARERAELFDAMAQTPRLPARPLPEITVQSQAVAEVLGVSALDKLPPTSAGLNSRVSQEPTR